MKSLYGTFVELEDRNPDGRGRGYLDGRAVLVSQGLPGESVQVLVDKETKGTIQGRIQHLVDPSPQRIETDCPHTFICTGCPLLGEDPEAELRFKRDVITKAVRSVSPDLEEYVVGVDRPSAIFGYRYYAKQVFEWGSDGVVLGSFVAGTHELVSNRDCPVLAPPLAQSLKSVESIIGGAGVFIANDKRGGLKYAVARLSKATGHVLMTWVLTAEPDDSVVEKLKAAAHQLMEQVPAVRGVAMMVNQSGGNVILSGGISTLAGTPEIIEKACGFEHSVGPRSFFQINPVSAETLFERALESAGQGEYCLELFSGVGVLTLPLAEKFSRVVAVEMSEEAAASLTLRVEREGPSNIESKCGDAQTLGTQILSEELVDVVVADPPRKGLGKTLCEAIGQSKVKRVVLLSCDPATLSRDLPDLIAAGFAVQGIWGIDQFPRTAHVETVTLLVRD